MKDNSKYSSNPPEINKSKPLSMINKQVSEIMSKSLPKETPLSLNIQVHSHSSLSNSLWEPNNEFTLNEETKKNPINKNYSYEYKNLRGKLTKKPLPIQNQRRQFSQKILKKKIKTREHKESINQVQKYKSVDKHPSDYNKTKENKQKIKKRKTYRIRESLFEFDKKMINDPGKVSHHIKQIFTNYALKEVFL